MSSVRVGIIGGGISGLSCAQALISAGCGVQIFDQGYRVGGRTSTRTHMDGRVIADHGAPSFRVDDPGFQSVVHAWIDAGVCSAWDDRFVGTPSMGSISRHLADGLPVQTSMRIEQVKQIEVGSWEVSSEQGAVDDRFDQLIIAAQPREVIRLLSGHAERLVKIASSVTMETVWVLIITIDNPLVGLKDQMDLPDNPVLERIIRDDRKPAREQSDRHSTLMVHACPEWSGAHKDAGREEIAEELKTALLERLINELGLQHTDLHVSSSIAHRWGSAFPIEGYSDRCASDHQRSVTICGDWMGWKAIEFGVQSAWLSGRAAAESVLAQ